MVICFVKSNWLDMIVPVDDTNFRIPRLELQWVGSLHSAAIEVDQDFLTDVTFPWTDLVSAANFATHLKAALVPRATALGYNATFNAIEIPGPTRVPVP